MMRYVYLGDRMTDDRLRGALCDPVRRPHDGKCIIGRNATQLVKFGDGRVVVVLRRRLRIREEKPLCDTV